MLNYCHSWDLDMYKISEHCPPQWTFWRSKIRKICLKKKTKKKKKPYCCSAFPAKSLGFTISLMRFLRLWLFSIPTSEVVTFRLRGWCMLGVFLFPSFTCHDMNVRIFWVIAMEYMCAETRPCFILSSERVLENGVRTHVNSKGKIPSTGGSQEDRTCVTASRRTASPTHYQLSYDGPHPLFIFAAISFDLKRSTLCSKDLKNKSKNNNKDLLTWTEFR